MRHLDLFSGIGGFALAAESVWPDTEHIFCDIEPFSQEVLRKHWPNAKIYGDIKTLTKKETGGGIYLLTGGFPCQPFSSAGRRMGTEDERHLWPEMLRLIREVSPRWVVGENVRGLTNWNGGLVFDEVQFDLETLGYEVLPFLLPAVAVNAPHRRDRIWFVAHAKSDADSGGAFCLSGEDGRPEWDNLSELGNSDRVHAGTPSNPRQKHGREGNREEMDGDSAERGTSATELKRCCENATNAECKGHERQEHKARQGARHSGRTQQKGWDENWVEVATRLCRVDDGIPRRMDRNSRLKALGNAIVPQVAEQIFKAIKATDLIT